MAGPNAPSEMKVILSAEDKVTGVMQGLLKEIKSVTTASDAAVGKSAASSMAAVETMGSKLRGLASAVDTAAAGMAATIGKSIIHSAMQTGMVMENETRRIMSFSDTTAAQMAKLRKDVDSTFATVQGGPEAALAAIRTGVLRGVSAEAIEAALPVINLHGIETGEGLEHGTESLISFANSIQAFHDDAGRMIASNSATQDQFVAGMRSAENVLIAANKVAPGSLKDQQTAMTIDGSVGLGLKIPLADIMAGNASLMEAGQSAALAGQHIKSAMGRLAAPSAPFRMAAADIGVDLDQFTHVNKDILTPEHVHDALKTALGTVTPELAAHVDRALAGYKAGGSQEEFHASLLDAIRTEGGKKSPVIAGNIAESVIAPAIDGVDFYGFMRAVAEHGGGVGFLDKAFGKETGGSLSPLLTQLFPEYREKFQETLPKDNVTPALKETEESYATAVNGLKQALSGLFDQTVFLPAKPAIAELSTELTHLVQGITGASDTIHSVMSATFWGATALGSIKTAGTMAKFAEGAGKFFGVIEEAGPVLTGLGLLAEIPFIPAAAGIAALATGIELFIHRADEWHRFMNWMNGTTDAPVSQEDADALRHTEGDIRQQRDARRAELTDNLPQAPGAQAEIEAADAVLARKATRLVDDPDYRAADERYETANREHVDSDGAVLAAKRHAETVREQLAKRAQMATASSYIRAIDRASASLAALNPTAGDTQLDQLRDTRTTLQAKPATPDNLAQIKSLDDAILARVAEDRRQLDAQLASEKKIREDALNHMGAPVVTQADVDKADADTVATQKEAADRIARDQAAAAAARNAAKDAVVARAKEDPEYRAHIDRAAELNDEAKAKAIAAAELDPKIVEANRKIADIEQKLMTFDGPRVGPQSADRRVEQQQHDAFADTPAMHYRPADRLVEDQAREAALHPAIAAVMTPATPQQVNVNSTVSGSVENKNSIEIRMMPNKYLDGQMAKIDSLSRVPLRVDSHDDLMAGVNGVAARAGDDMMGPNGLGHR